MRSLWTAVLLVSAVSIAKAQKPFHPTCPTTATGARIVATKMIDTTDDLMTGQRSFRMLYEVRPRTGAVSDMRICVGKDVVASEPIPPKLPPQETLAPPVVAPPPATTTIVNPPLQIVTNKCGGFLGAYKCHPWLSGLGTAVGIAGGVCVYKYYFTNGACFRREINVKATANSNSGSSGSGVRRPVGVWFGVSF